MSTRRLVRALAITATTAILAGGFAAHAVVTLERPASETLLVEDVGPAFEIGSNEWSYTFVRGADEDTRVLVSRYTDHVVDGVTIGSPQGVSVAAVPLSPPPGERLAVGRFPVALVGEAGAGEVAIDVSEISECASPLSGEIDIIDVSYEGAEVVSVAARYLISCTETVQLDGYVWHDTAVPFTIMYAAPIATWTVDFGKPTERPMFTILGSTAQVAATIDSVEIIAPPGVTVEFDESCVGVTLTTLDDQCETDLSITSTRQTDTVILATVESDDLPLGTTGAWPIVLRTRIPASPVIEWTTQAFDGVALAVLDTPEQILRWWRRAPGQSDWHIVETTIVERRGRHILIDRNLAPGESAEYRVENHWTPGLALFSQPVTLTRAVDQPDPIIDRAAISLKQAGQVDYLKSRGISSTASLVYPNQSWIAFDTPIGSSEVFIEPRLPDGSGIYSLGHSDGEYRISVFPTADPPDCVDGTLWVRDSITRADGRMYRADIAMTCTNPAMTMNLRVGLDAPTAPPGVVTSIESSSLGSVSSSFTSVETESSSQSGPSAVSSTNWVWWRYGLLPI